MVIRSPVLCRQILINHRKLNKRITEQNRSFISESVVTSGATPCIDTVAQRIEEESIKYAAIQSNDLRVRLAQPHMLQPKPEASDLVFGKNFTDHMLKIYYHHHLGGWQKPEITPIEPIPLHPAAKVLHYAVEIFEGMKAYRGIDCKIRLFRPDLNMKRMNVSAQRTGLPLFDGDEFIKCLSRLINIDQEWVPHIENASLYIRPTMIGIDPVLGVYYPRSALLFAILCPVGSYFKQGSAISLLADPRYARAWPGGSGDTKTGANYGPTIWPQRIASESKLDQILWLFGEDHQLTEVGTMNIFMVYLNKEGEKVLITPPLNGLILPGITRKAILELACDISDVKVCEKTFNMKFLLDLLEENRLLELFGAGTAVIVTPIESIVYLGKKYRLPTLETPNPLYVALKTKLEDIQYGRIEHPWATVIQS
ncbi:branched-chain-amino-acid aminotransferase, cytosolic-like [Ctenocephalides felis]|uniref:branched-chain-amino-acid aminotransferase, cytosolic-like n=1 Tax=Ctenocephalides felis TaxID=7515 RepID=UPI000E6E3DA8|nr:branched-chain-amino-acid aminotransferase, cytosolic-like [Ctenocephalides felis]